jgi:hypothetical protein
VLVLSPLGVGDFDPATGGGSSGGHRGRQIVFTIPKLLRVYFRNDRRLLGDLCRVAAGVIAEGIRALLGKEHLTPGVVICVQTYGNFVNWNPHLHCIVTDGGFTPAGVLHVLPRVTGV